ncbi:MAG: glycosyltransferase family 2 protein [Bacteroidetes bacterium]|nr:MAG: glycosyltransferase family 2 protein [Bacteroidota bacterium]
MNQKPLVSIIIPLYNADKYLSETIKSVINQTYTHWELLIINDGSTDQSLEVARKFVSAKIKVFDQENKGAGAARNFGLKEAKGEYIQFLDADDLLSSNKIEVQVRLLENTSEKVAVCPTVHFFDGQDLSSIHPSAYENSFLFSTGNTFEFLINLYGGSNNKGSMIQTNAWLVPANLIKKAGNWEEFYSPDDDGEFFCRVLLSAKGVVYTPNCSNYYRKFKNGSSLASTKEKRALEGIFKSLMLKKKHLTLKSNDSRINKVIARAAIEIAYLSYPKYKELTNIILNEIEALGGTNYIPVLGGKVAETLKKVFGWKVAKYLIEFNISIGTNFFGKYGK